MKSTYIDVTPTWSAILPVLLAVYENGKKSGRDNALAELQRMAEIADAAVEAEKAQRGDDK